MLCFPQCNYAPHVRMNRICASITLRKAIMPCFPNVIIHKNFKEKPCLELDGSRARRAAEARRTQRLTPLAFAPPRIQIYCENAGVGSFPYFQTCTLPHACHANCHLLAEPPHDWASQLWATCWLLYHLTELVNCELPLVYSTTWLSCSSVDCSFTLLPLDWAIQLLITLPLDWAIQLWATSWLLYRLTELVNCEPPVDYSTAWLNYSIVSYLLITLPLDWSLQFWATSWLITLPLDWAIQLFVTVEVSN